MATPAVCVATGCCVMTQRNCELVAVAVTESGVTPALPMLSVCVPTAGPRVHVADARPPASVFTVAGATLPPPLATVNVMGTFTFALPLASVSATVMGDSAVLAAAVCVPPVTSTMFVAGPVTMLNAGLDTPARPVALAVITYPVPGWPMVTFVKLATPPTAAAVVVPPSVAPAAPPASESDTVPVKLVTGSPSASRARATNVVARPAERLAFAAGVVVNTSFVATVACAVALKVTGDPASDPEVAATVCAPTVLPSVHDVCASPLASVVAEAGDTEPPPVETAKATFTPATGRPSVAETFTTSGWASFGAVGLPMIPVCPPPDTAAMVDGTGCTLSVTVSALAVIEEATISTGPRTVRAFPLPCVGARIVARVGSSEVQKIGVSGTGAPAASTATAV